MKILNEPGVLFDSWVGLHVPTEFAQRHLFYSHIGGSYHCDAPYRIDREYLESFIIFLVNEGQVAVDYRGQSFLAHAGQIILLDCKFPQSYWMDKPGRFKWFHFAGNASQAMYDVLTASRGPVFNPDDILSISTLIDLVILMMEKDNVDEYRTSSLIHQLLTALISPSSEASRVPQPSVRKAMDFIESHLSESITLNRIAEQVNLSPFYFNKLFKKHAACTPHEYLTNVRLKLAIRLLKQTSDSLEEISEQCGFNSATHFIRCFSQHIKMTPGQYRNMRY